MSAYAGALNRIRNDDLALTKGVPCQLSYEGGVPFFYLSLLALATNDRAFESWCQGQDSNLRSPSGQRFYRPSVLATHPPWLARARGRSAGLRLFPKAGTARWADGARGGIRTLNLPITNRLRCRCATRAEPVISLHRQVALGLTKLDPRNPGLTSQYM